MSPVSDVKQVLRGQIASALRTLRRKAALSDEAVHRARKDLKRARASLRLLRDAVGVSVYARENAALRDAARPLSAVRDAKVMLGTLEDFLAHEKKRSPRDLLLQLRALLRKAGLRARREIRVNGDVSRSVESLVEAKRRVEHWRVSGKSAACVYTGLKHIYRKGRKALGEVDAKCSAENLHEWRKQVKYLGHAMEVFEPTRARGLAKLIDRAGSVGDALGEDHDLVVLCDRIASLRSGSRKAHQGLVSEIAERRAALQAKAFKKGRGLYKQKPKCFIRRFQAGDRG